MEGLSFLTNKRVKPHTWNEKRSRSLHHHRHHQNCRSQRDRRHCVGSGGQQSLMHTRQKAHKMDSKISYCLHPNTSQLDFMSPLPLPPTPMNSSNLPPHPHPTLQKEISVKFDWTRNKPSVSHKVNVVFPFLLQRWCKSKHKINLKQEWLLVF